TRDKSPSRRFRIAPADLKLLDGNPEHLRHHDRDAGMRVRSQVAGADRHMDLAAAVHPHQAIRRVAPGVLLAEAHAQPAAHAAGLLRWRPPILPTDRLHTFV